MNSTGTFLREQLLNEKNFLSYFYIRLNIRPAVVLP